MGLDQRFIETSNNDRSIDMRKLYPVHNFFVSDNSHVVGEVHLDTEKVEQLINHLYKWLKTDARNAQNTLAERYPNGVSLFDMEPEDQKLFRDYMDIDQVHNVIHWLQDVKKSEDTLLVYVFNS